MEYEKFIISRLVMKPSPFIFVILHLTPEYMALFNGHSQHFRFDGDVASYLGTAILAFFLVVFTLGLGIPWAVTMVQGWVAKHTIIDGRRLAFKGTGAELFGLFIVWWFLCIITLGIYSLWVGPKMTKWVVENTDFETVTQGVMNQVAVGATMS